VALHIQHDLINERDGLISVEWQLLKERRPSGTPLVGLFGRQACRWMDWPRRDRLTVAELLPRNLMESLIQSERDYLDHLKEQYEALVEVWRDREEARQAAAALLQSLTDCTRHPGTSVEDFRPELAQAYARVTRAVAPLLAQAR
jgi:hypothetical protein